MTFSEYFQPPYLYHQHLEPMTFTYDNSISWYEPNLSALQLPHHPPSDCITAKKY